MGTGASASPNHGHDGNKESLSATQILRANHDKDADVFDQQMRATKSTPDVTALAHPTPITMPEDDDGSGQQRGWTANVVSREEKERSPDPEPSPSPDPDPAKPAEPQPWAPKVAHEEKEEPKAWEPR